MLFALSKIVGALLRPFSLLLAALVLSLAWRRSRPRTSTALLAGATVAVALLNLTPTAYWLVHPLEARFPPPALPAHVDGIVVLGGAIEVGGFDALHQPELNESAERVTAAVALTRRYPDARLLFSGGHDFHYAQGPAEADIARQLLDSLGVDTGNALFERESRNTWENAVDSLKLAHPGEHQTWLLVTSAWHMPRAVGCFRRAGWNVVPYPVDYFGPQVNRWFGFDGDEQLRTATFALKEWVGLVAYHLLGRTDAFFPSPSVPPT